MDPQSYQIVWTPMDDEPSPEIRAEEMRKLHVDAEEYLPRPTTCQYHWAKELMSTYSLMQIMLETKVPEDRTQVS